MNPEQTEQLRRFLRDYISSYEELEVLLLLAREPRTAMTSTQLAASLNVPVESIVAALESLASTGGLLHREERGSESYYGYAPGDDEQRERVSELARAYSEQPLAIIRIMSANAVERVRGAAARRLADAFRLERPKK